MIRPMTSSGATLVLAIAMTAPAGARPGDDWLHWRGPHQTGASDATGLPESITLGGDGELWTYPIAGRGTPVVSDGRVYSLGYEGEGKDLQEVLICLDGTNGEQVWEHRFNDFLSDVIYDRYSIGSPTIDPSTGDVFALSSAGELTAFTADGRILWQRSMLSEFGRLTFPNGRTGAPIVDGDRVIIHVITAHWGPDAPARDRFYAFDTRSGDLVWSCTPGVGPKDNSFSPPYLDFENGRRVLYAGTGCGNIACIDARTGDALWRFQLTTGGVNSAVVRHGDHLIAIHGRENVDSTVLGRMIALKLAIAAPPSGGNATVLAPDTEAWRNDLVAFSSSPVLAGDRVYVTDATGELACVDAASGTVLWREKLAPDQIHASPLFADGKLYVPMNNGSFHIVRPSDSGPEILQSVQLEGNCLGAPSAGAGGLFVHTTAKLYCFGRRPAEAPARPAVTRLQVVPADLLLTQGSRAPLRVRGLDATGAVVAPRLSDVEWSMKGDLDLTFTDDGGVAAPQNGRTGVGVAVAKANGVTGSMRVRVVNRLPYVEDFESIPLQPAPSGEGVPAGFPPSSWIGARAKFEVRELDGSKVLAKTLDNTLFQRSMATFGTPEMSDYTMQLDVKSDGNRRSMSTAGLIHQRYLASLKGNHQELEISSNMERMKESVPFRWQPGSWYTLKTRVDVAADGSGVIRAKAWKRDEPEPEAWTIEVSHAHAHRRGSPGLFGFSPQSRFCVYVDNLQVTPND